MRARSRAVALAVVAAAAVAASLLSPLPADAATHASTSSLADSIRRGTVQEDILSGRITVDQLTDAAMAARSAPVAHAPIATTPVPTRAEMEREVAGEVQSAREETLAAVSADLAASAGSSPRDVFAAPGRAPATGDPLRTSAFWGSIIHVFRHLLHNIHWWEWWLPPWLIKTLIGPGATLTIGLLCAIPGVSAMTCGLMFAASTLFVGIVNGIKSCIQVGYYIEIPDFGHSHCHA